MRLTLPRLLLVALLPLALASPLWGPWAFRRLDVFRVERVEVVGTHLLAPHEVLAASGLREGQNVWDDPEPWLAALRAHPAVREAAVERVLPRTLRLRVEEQRPVALVELGTLRPVTAEGVVLPVDPTRAPVDLPLLRTPAARASETGLESEAVRRLLAETGRIAELDPALFARVSEVRPAAAGELLLVLGQPAAELMLPAGAEPERLRRLRAVLEDLERRGLVPAARPGRAVRVDLRFADQIVVRLPSSS